MTDRLASLYCEMKRRNMTAKLRQEVETMRQSDAFGEMLSGALELALSDLTQDEMNRLRESF
jgi:hypothetical protein